jgi:hypothetical protein
MSWTIISRRFFRTVAHDQAVFDVFAVDEGDAVGQGPGIALAGDGAELVGDGEPLFVRGDDGGEKFAGEFLPEMVEEIFEGAADRAVIIGGAEEQDIGGGDALLEGIVVGGAVGGVGIKERAGVRERDRKYRRGSPRA